MKDQLGEHSLAGYAALAAIKILALFFMISFAVEFVFHFKPYYWRFLDLLHVCGPCGRHNYYWRHKQDAVTMGTILKYVVIAISKIFMRSTRIVAYGFYNIRLKQAALLALLFNSVSYYLVTPFSKMLVILIKLGISVISMILVVVKATLNFFWRLLGDHSDSSKGGLFYRIVHYCYICLKPAAVLAALNSVSYYLITPFSKILLILMKLVISVIWMILKTLEFFWRLIVAEPSNCSKGRLFYIT